MGSERSQPVTFSKDSIPKCDGTGDLRQWQVDVRRWCKLQDKLIAAGRKGITAEIRGLMLLGSLSGSARKLAQKVTDEVIESAEGVQAILDAVVVRDPIADAQVLQVAWERLDNTLKTPKGDFCQLCAKVSIKLC